jgi:hypothetical protein
MPAAVADARDKKAVPQAEWTSPSLCLDQYEGPYYVAVNARFPFTAVRGATDMLVPLFRIREQLLMSLIGTAGAYQTRPGIVKLPE